MRSPDRAGSDRLWTRRYLLGAHSARIAVAAFAVYVAARTIHEIPVAGALSIGLAVAGLAWMIALALAWRPIDSGASATSPADLGRRRGHRVARARQQAVGRDGRGALQRLPPLGGLLLAARHPDPDGILAVLSHAEAAPHRDRLAPRGAGATGQLGALAHGLCGVGVAGVICWALCTLVRGVRQASREWDVAQRALTAASLRHAEAQARRALADRLHETISQVVRAIPLRLDGTERPG